MDKHVRWIEYRGKKILYCDYSALKGREYDAVLDETMQEIRKLPDGAVAPSISNLTGTSMSNMTAAKGRQVAALVKSKNLKGPTVLVGVSGLVSSVASLMQPDLHFAKSVEEAKEWIVSHPQ